MVLKGLFSKLTVDSIISDIRLKVEQLHAVKELKIEEEKLHDAEIAARTKLKAEAQAEWARALRLADKFNELIS